MREAFIMSILLKLASWKFQFFPRKITLFFGWIIGLFFYHFIPMRKSVALKNVSMAFPDNSPSENNQLIKNCFRHFGMVLTEFLRLPALNSKNINKIVKIDTQSKQLLESCSGGIILTAHLGNWEYILPAFGLNGISMAAVAQIQKNKKSNTFFNDLRKTGKITILPINTSSGEMLKLLKQGYFLGLASDQNAGRKGTDVPFFGMDVSVPKGAAIFHLKTNSPILVGFCILSPDFTYHLSFKELDVEGLSGNKNEAIVEINRRYSKLLEEEIRENPQQYFWFHRKWAKKNYRGLPRF